MGLGPAGAMFFEGVGRVRFKLGQQTCPERSHFGGWWAQSRRFGQVAGLPPPLEPAFDGPERHQELLGDFGPGHATIHGVNDSDPEILGIGLHTHQYAKRAT
jgi:hypothetical protein